MITPCSINHYLCASRTCILNVFIWFKCMKILIKTEPCVMKPQISMRCALSGGKGGGKSHWINWLFSPRAASAIRESNPGPPVVGKPPSSVVATNDFVARNHKELSVLQDEHLEVSQLFTVTVFDQFFRSRKIFSTTYAIVPFFRNFKMSKLSPTIFIKFCCHSTPKGAPACAMASKSYDGIWGTLPKLVQKWPWK